MCVCICRYEMVKTLNTASQMEKQNQTTKKQKPNPEKKKKT